MAKAAAGRDQGDEATQENTPFIEHLFARPFENRGRMNPDQWRPLQSARGRNKTFFLFCCVRIIQYNREEFNPNLPFMHRPVESTV